MHYQQSHPIVSPPFPNAQGQCQQHRICFESWPNLGRCPYTILVLIWSIKSIVLSILRSTDDNWLKAVTQHSRKRRTTFGRAYPTWFSCSQYTRVPLATYGQIEGSILSLALREKTRSLCCQAYFNTKITPSSTFFLVHIPGSLDSSIAVICWYNPYWELTYSRNSTPNIASSNDSNIFVMILSNFKLWI